MCSVPFSVPPAKPALKYEHLILEAERLGITDFVIGLLMGGKECLMADGRASYSLAHDGSAWITKASYLYDMVGNLTKQTDAEGIVVSSTPAHDGYGRLTRSTAPAGHINSALSPIPKPSSVLVPKCFSSLFRAPKSSKYQLGR